MKIEQMAEKLCEKFLKVRITDELSQEECSVISSAITFNAPSCYNFLSSPTGLDLLKQAVLKLGVDYSCCYRKEYKHFMYSIYDDYNHQFSTKYSESDATIDGVYNYLEVRGDI